MIIDIVYANTARTEVIIHNTEDDLYGPYDDGLTGVLVAEWEAAGNTVLPYDPYYGWTLEQAYEIKKNESDAYAQNLIDEAFTNPQIGVVTDGNAHKRRTESRRKDKADKQAGEIALTQDEKDEAKVDQKLSEFETKAWDASDKVHGNIDKEDTVNDVMAIDVETNTIWPIWEPPV